jgi:hypothetical protein
MVDVGFTNGHQLPPPSLPKGNPPPPGATTESPPSSEPPREEPQPRGWRDRIGAFRDRATGGRRPVGSPEDEDRRRSRLTSSSRVSSKAKRRTVDGCATGVRSITLLFDQHFGTEERDLVATADECYEIAAPIAGYLLDRFEESETIATVVEYIGPGAAVVRLGAYLGRAFTGQPGGRVEVELAREGQRRRMSHAERQAAAEEQAAGEREPEHRYRDFVTVADG